MWRMSICRTINDFRVRAKKTARTLPGWWLSGIPEIEYTAAPEAAASIACWAFHAADDGAKTRAFVRLVNF